MSFVRDPISARDSNHNYSFYHIFHEFPSSKIPSSKEKFRNSRETLRINNWFANEFSNIEKKDYKFRRNSLELLSKSVE